MVHILFVKQVETSYSLSDCGRNYLSLEAEEKRKQTISSIDQVYRCSVERKTEKVQYFICNFVNLKIYLRKHPVLRVM